MKVLALIRQVPQTSIVLLCSSGGKDSTFNMMKCIQEGHEIIALGNMYPSHGKEELDSYMYQSVGHDAIEAVAECLELPLYRRQIKGRPANLEYDYQPTEEDEVEDLYELVKHVKQVHPDLEGVSSGAIFSTYQKNRVENICARLGLVSLAYLWEREQKGLLTEMIESNLHAILIKVAVWGLGREDLGKSITEMQPKLFELETKYGVNVCGEGGEFETLTLDCPLYKKRIVIDETEVIVHRDKADASVFYLKIRKLHTEPK